MALMTTFVLIHGAFGGGWNWDPPIEYQRRMLQAMPCEKVVTFATDHVPMASATAQFARELLALA